MSTNKVTDINFSFPLEDLSYMIDALSLQAATRMCYSDKKGVDLLRAHQHHMESLAPRILFYYKPDTWHQMIVAAKSSDHCLIEIEKRKNCYSEHYEVTATINNEKFITDEVYDQGMHSYKGLPVALALDLANELVSLLQQVSSLDAKVEIGETLRKKRHTETDQEPEV